MSSLDIARVVPVAHVDPPRVLDGDGDRMQESFPGAAIDNDRVRAWRQPAHDVGHIVVLAFDGERFLDETHAADVTAIRTGSSWKL